LYIVTSEYFASNRRAVSNYVSKHSDGNYFQSPEMYDFFNKIEKYEPITLVVHNERGVIQGSLLAVIQKEFCKPLGFFTARTIVWGGPLVSGIDSVENCELVNLLIKSLVYKVRNKSIYIQFRSFFDQSAYSYQFQKNEFKYSEHLNYIVKTNDLEDVKRRFSKSKIRQIKKSLKNGAKIVEPADIQQVLEFYNLLKELYHSKIKKPIPPKSFFINFYEETIRNGSGTYLLIKYNDRIIGGIMCPITKGRTIYEWYVCGLDRMFNGIYPSVLATWAPIEYALNNGLECFDFMGAGKHDKDYGVREFKSKFGGELVKYGRFERINHNFLYKLGKLGLAALNKI